jgi:autotransporter-associated beta strand protein
MKTKSYISICLALMTFAGAHSTKAASHTWTGSVSSLWSNPLNWDGGAPQIGEANVVLNFEYGATRNASTNDIGNISVDDIVFTGNNFTLGGYFITLTGVSFYNLDCQNSGNVIAMDMVLNSSLEYFKVDFNCSLTLKGALSGPGGFTKWGDGILSLTGSNANTYSATTYAYGGILNLGKSSSVNAIAGPLVLGQYDNPTNSATVDPTNIVQLASSEQIANNAPITFNPAGYIDLNGYNETVGTLTMTGGAISGNGGTLTLNGDVTGTSVWNNHPSFYGNLSLGGTNRIFKTLTKDSAILLEGIVSDGGSPAGIIKLGTNGGLRLDATNNTYTGTTIVGGGWLGLLEPGGLGSSASGTVVSNGAEINIGLDFHGPVETLTLMGGSRFVAIGTSNSWDGNIVLNGDAEIDVDDAANNETLDINGVISGTGNITMQFGGTLRFKGSSPNTYNGRTTIIESTTLNRVSTLELRKPNNVVAVPGPLIIGGATNPPVSEFVVAYSDNQIADTAQVTVNPSGELDLNDHFDTIGSLSGSNGVVNLNTGAITSGGDNADSMFGGVISGTGPVSLTKIGSGHLVLTGNNNCTGKMVVNAGDLYVNGIQSCPVEVNSSSKLHGQGLTGTISGLGGSFAPGDNITAPTHGQMLTPNLMLDGGSIFDIDLAGPASMGKYDQLIVGGSVTLSNATLHLTQSSSGLSNDVFTIIRNNGAGAVKGTFIGMPEGAILVLSPLQQFKLTYVGGASGHDVTLTQITPPLPPSLSGIIKLGNGQIQLTGTGVLGQAYSVLANTNIATTNWVNIGMVVSDQSGGLTFIDPNAPNYQQRFYRFRSP